MGQGVKHYTQWYENKTSTTSYIKIHVGRRRQVCCFAYVTDAYLISLILLMNNFLEGTEVIRWFQGKAGVLELLGY